MYEQLTCCATTCLENWELLGNLITAREMSRNLVSQGIVREKILSGKMCPVRTAEFCFLPYFIFMLLWITVF